MARRLSDKMFMEMKFDGDRLDYIETIRPHPLFMFSAGENDFYIVICCCCNFSIKGFMLTFYLVPCRCIRAFILSMLHGLVFWCLVWVCVCGIHLSCTFMGMVKWQNIHIKPYYSYRFFLFCGKWCLWGVILYFHANVEFYA